MIVQKIVYNEGKNEGYFVKTPKGYVHIRINEGEGSELKNIKSIKEVSINPLTLRVEEIKNGGAYIN